MEFGNYRPLKYRLHEIYKTYQFTNVIQVWLAVLSFSLFIVTLLWNPIWGWWKMNLSPLQWIAYVMGSVLVLFFILISFWSFVSFVIVLFRGWFGITINYTKGQLPPEIESAVEFKKLTNKGLMRAVDDIVGRHSSDTQYLVNVLKHIIDLEVTHDDAKPKP